MASSVDVIVKQLQGCGYWLRLLSGCWLCLNVNGCRVFEIHFEDNPMVANR